MLIYGTGYSYLKYQYVVPLAQHSIRYASITKNNIKTILSQGMYSSVQNVGQNHFLFTFDEDIIIPALLGDLWMCYIRTYLQKDAAQKNYGLIPDYCPNWSIVTDYYFAFYCASTVLRLTMRGTIYFEPGISSKINANVSSILGSIYSVKENSIYSIKRDPSREGVYIMDLKGSSHQTHETVWHETANVIKCINMNSTPKSDEQTFTTCLMNVLKEMDNNFPSKLRNAVNYQLPFGIKAIEKKVFPAYACVQSDSWVDKILTFDGITNDIFDLRVQLFSSYTKYLDGLVNNLICEYYDIQGKQCGVQKAINKNRSVPIVFPSSAVYTY